MCLLITQDLARNNKLTKELFTNAWNQNPHGFGVGYYRGAEPVIYATMERENGWKLYEHAVEEVQQNAKATPSQPQQLLAHWRWSTGGGKALSNVHPFFVPIKNGIILAHNGSTSHVGVVRPEGWSDTRTFAEMWLREKAPNILTDEDDVKKVLEQIGASRLALMTPWTTRTMQFPNQDKKEYQQYGNFSNFIFDPVYKPKKEYSTINSGYSGHRVYKEFLALNNEDREKWREGSDKYRYKYLSPNMVHRAMCYCIKTNMSFGSAILMFKRLFDDFPGHTQIKDFSEAFEETLDLIATHYNEPLLNKAIEVCDQEYSETADELLGYWMDYNEILVKERKLTKKEKKELEKALAEQQKDPETKDIILTPEEEQWQMENDFENKQNNKSKTLKLLENNSQKAGNKAFQN